jgi:hypothetical protein
MMIMGMKIAHMNPIMDCLYFDANIPPGDHIEQLAMLEQLGYGF